MQRSSSTGGTMSRSQLRRARTLEMLDSVLETQIGNQDPSNAVTKISQRLHRVGLTFPGVEVRFDKLKVEVEVEEQASGVPTLANATAAMLQAVAAKARGQSVMQKKPILYESSGVLKPGRMCLLLGPPGSGRTTLLKALSGQLQRDGQVKVSGGITYNGLKPGKDFVVERVASYIDQRDNHIAEMSVGETLGFASECLGPEFARRLYEAVVKAESEQGIEPEPDLDKMWLAIINNKNSSKQESVLVELYARMMGIDHVMDTLLGNDMLKGVSGGQKRRVTSAEMFVGEARVMMMDEISNGLDSATTFNIVKALRKITTSTHATMLISLLQPGPEIFDLFDDVLLMSHGRIVFFGPREEVVPFFASLHLHCPPAMMAADFLQEVTTFADQQRYWSPPADAPAEQREWKWITPPRLQAEYTSTPAGKAMAEALAAPAYKHPLQGMVLHKNKYAQSLASMISTVMRRESLLLKRNTAFFQATVGQSVVSAFLVSTTFTRLSRDNLADGNLYLSVIFYSFMITFMGGFNYVPIFCQRLPVFYRQRNQNFYKPWIYALSSVLLRLPEVTTSATVFAIMVYFSVGLVMDAGRFFIYWLSLVCMGMVATSMFQFFGSFMRSDSTTQGLGSFALMAFINVSGFPIARTSVPGWWIWALWINPMSWCMRTLGINEMMSRNWSEPAGDDHPGQTLGEYVLNLRGLYTDWSWVWAGVGVMIGSVFILTGLQALMLSWLGPLVTSRPVNWIDGVEEASIEQDTLLLEGSNSGSGSGAKKREHSVLVVPRTLEPGQQQIGNPQAQRRQQQQQQAPASPSGSAASSSRSGDAAIEVIDNAPGTALAVMGNGIASSSVQMGPLAKAAAGAVAAAVVPGAPKGGRRAAMSFLPVTMTFKDICYFVPKPKDKGELQLLRNVSGAFRPGVLTALMGASGAGKTTLMDVLAGRKTGGRAEGTELLNGHPKTMRAFARVSGYVEQFDVHNSQATVLESLLFSARMRLPYAEQKEETLMEYINEAMELVELTPLANVMVGTGPGNGLTLEQRKRLTIAVELVSNPSLVFMDEPTTGLDARAAAMVMRATRNIVNGGRTVVCTIHQPNKDIFCAFDELLLLKPGGRVIFSGAVGPNQERLINYFMSIDGVPGMAPSYNPANWMLEVSGPAQEQELGVDFGDLWQQSGLAKEEAAACEVHSTPAPGSKPITFSESGNNGGFAVPVTRQTALLVHRSLTTAWRSPQYNLLRFIVTIIMGLMFGTLYWARGNKRTSLLGVLDILGGLYSCTIFMGMFNTLTAIPVVIADRAVYYRERAARMYAVLPYTIAQGFAELPYLAAQACLYTVIVYFTIQFEFEAVKFFWFLLFLFLNLLAFTFFGVAAAQLTPTPAIATAFGGLFLNFWNLFCGFLVYRPDIPPWWVWIYYWNPATWALYGMISTQLGNVTNEFIDVGEGELKSVAQYVEDTFEYKYAWRGWVALILVGMIVCFRLVAWLSLAKLNFTKR